MLLIKETCNRFVKENDKILWYLFSWIVTFLRIRSQHFSIGLSIHLFICLSNICWVHTMCQKYCVHNMWECAFVTLYLFILTIACSTCDICWMNYRRNSLKIVRSLRKMRKNKCTCCYLCPPPFPLPTHKFTGKCGQEVYFLCMSEFL